MDDPVDRLNGGCTGRSWNWPATPAAGVGDPDEHGRPSLERVGDNAVDIGEQVGFLLTGEFREFTDASHPAES